MHVARGVPATTGRSIFFEGGGGGETAGDTGGEGGACGPGLQAWVSGLPVAPGAVSDTVSFFFSSFPTS